MTNEAGRAEFRMLDIRLDVEIGAPRDAVWRSLTEQIAEWWPAKFYVGRAPRRFAIEPQVGLWLNLILAGAADLGLVLFLVLPGYMPWAEGAPGLVLFVPAALCSLLGQTATRGPVRGPT